ncbi:fucolectin-like [Lissotriton helveticus]
MCRKEAHREDAQRSQKSRKDTKGQKRSKRNDTKSKKRMKAALTAAFVCTLLLVVDSAGTGENVALGGRATQSSILAGEWSHQGYLAHAINAIDGNQDPNFLHGSCTHTDYQQNPWWRVDLLKPHKMYSISITNRNSHPERLNGAEILIGNSPSNYGNNNARCAYISGIGAGATQTFYCHGMVGRYVNIIIQGRQECLALCEVQVFAEPELQNQGK